MTELERKALLGDQAAQRECTEKGIVLPCPVCGKSVHWDFDSELVYHNYGGCFLSGKFIPLPYWNTRSAPPIGRCWECKHWGGIDEYGDGFCHNPDGIDNIAKSEDFCSYFEPKESEGNAVD